MISGAPAQDIPELAKVPLSRFAISPCLTAAGASTPGLQITCGHNDGTGDFACKVGLPGKSEIGSAILAIAPKVASIVIWSPGLNRYGNSHAGTRGVAMLSQATG
jgi:glutaminase